MSPEQCQGITSTEASDVYAIGIIFWEFLTGEVPFRFDEAMPESDFTKLLQHVTAPLPAERFDAEPRFAPLRSTVFEMLDKTPRMRPSIRRIMSVLKEVTPGILAG